MFHKGLHVFVMSFKCQNDITTSNAMFDVIFQRQLTSVGERFENCYLKLFHITRSFNIGHIGEVFSNLPYVFSVYIKAHHLSV